MYKYLLVFKFYKKKGATEEYFIVILHELIDQKHIIYNNKNYIDIESIENIQCFFKSLENGIHNASYMWTTTNIATSNIDSNSYIGHSICIYKNGDDLRIYDSTNTIYYKNTPENIKTFMIDNKFNTIITLNYSIKLFN